MFAHGEFETANFRASPLHDLARKPCSKTLTNRKLQLKLLCEIVPDLVQWRLFVFYAPFYSILDLRKILSPSSVSTPDELSSKDTELPMRPHRSSVSAKHGDADPYDNAHRIATTIHIRLAKTLRQIDLAGVVENYKIQRNKQKNRPQRHGVTSTKDLLTLELVEQVSHKLDIPIRQIELALSMYRDFEIERSRLAVAPFRSRTFAPPSSSPSAASLRSSSTRSSPNHKIGANNTQSPYVVLPRSTRRIYGTLDAEDKAVNREWSDLANIISKDIEDVTLFSIFAKDEREQQTVLDVMVMHRDAIHACKVKHSNFIEARFGSGELDPGQEIKVTCLGRYLWRIAYSISSNWSYGLHLWSKFVYSRVRDIVDEVSRQGDRRRTERRSREDHNTIALCHGAFRRPPRVNYRDLHSAGRRPRDNVRRKAWNRDLNLPAIEELGKGSAS